MAEQQPSVRKQLPIPPLPTTAYTSKRRKPEEKKSTKERIRQKPEIKPQ